MVDAAMRLVDVAGLPPVARHPALNASLAQSAYCAVEYAAIVTRDADDESEITLALDAAFGQEVLLRAQQYDLTFGADEMQAVKDLIWAVYRRLCVGQPAGIMIREPVVVRD